MDNFVPRQPQRVLADSCCNHKPTYMSGDNTQLINISIKEKRIEILAFYTKVQFSPLQETIIAKEKYN